VGWAAGDCVLGWAGRRCRDCVLIRAPIGTLGTAIYYLNKLELSSGFEFQYSQKPYRYQSSGYTGSGSGFSGLGL
jgi:hypothetical protein